jgi:hypothetical protein
MLEEGFFLFLESLDANAVLLDKKDIIANNILVSCRTRDKLDLILH